MEKKIDTKNLIKKIAKITKERITKENVVNLNQYREFKTGEKQPKTLLIIEDDETMRRALARIFEADGHTVRTVADGTQLFKVLDDHPIDLIILDIGLPWINGFELAKLLKEHKDLKQIPLVFISAKTSEMDVKKGFEVGANDYIKKPFDIDVMKRSVDTLLKIS